MKIVTNITEAKALEIGDEYIIEPKGLDYQKPETLVELAPEIEKLQNAVEESIEKKIKKKKIKKKKIKKESGEE